MVDAHVGREPVRQPLVVSVLEHLPWHEDAQPVALREGVAVARDQGCCLLAAGIERPSAESALVGQLDQSRDLIRFGRGRPADGAPAEA